MVSYVEGVLERSIKHLGQPILAVGIVTTSPMKAGMSLVLLAQEVLAIQLRPKGCTKSFTRKPNAGRGEADQQGRRKD